MNNQHNNLSLTIEEAAINSAAPLFDAHNLNSSLTTEVMFLISNNSTLRLRLGDYNKHALAHLKHKIARRSCDLLSHIQRIYLTIETLDQDGLYGALLDLFIALETKGFYLRKRLLVQSRLCLTEEHFQALHEQLGSGITAADPMPITNSSVLTKGYIGTNLFIKRRPLARTKTLRDPLIEDTDYLEYGQVQEARRLLERAVMKEPWRRDLQDELLEIYRVTRDGKNCDAMYERLADCFIPDHFAWTQTAEQIHQLVEAV